jgi:hypothetical protein
MNNFKGYKELRLVNIKPTYNKNKRMLNKNKKYHLNSTKRL